MITRNHMLRPVRWSRIFFGVAVGMLILVSAQIALAGTTFVDGKKVETCQGSTCSPGSGNGGNGAAPAIGVGVGIGVGGSGGQSNATATNQTTVIASPHASASSSAKSSSTSRSSSRSSATGGNATATGGQASANASNGNQTTSVNIAAPRAADLGNMVPDVMAPSLTTSGDDMCSGSISGGLGLSGIGAMLGFTFTDEHCQTIKATKLLVTIGRPQAAIRRACMDDRMRDALGAECPEPRKEEQPSSLPSFTH